MKHIINIFHGDNEMVEHVVGTPVLEMFLKSQHRKGWLEKWAESTNITGYVITSLQKEYDGIRQHFYNDKEEKN